MGHHNLKNMGILICHCETEKSEVNRPEQNYSTDIPFNRRSLGGLT